MFAIQRSGFIVTSIVILVSAFYANAAAAQSIEPAVRAVTPDRNAVKKQGMIQTWVKTGLFIVIFTTPVTKVGSPRRD